MKRNIGPTTLVLLVFAMFVVSMASPSALRLGSELNDKIDSHQVEKECSKEERDRWLDLMTEATGVMHDARTQQDRYHALGY